MILSLETLNFRAMYKYCEAPGAHNNIMSYDIAYLLLHFVLYVNSGT